MRITKSILTTCCATFVLTSLLALNGNAQQGPILNLTPEVPVINSCELKRSSTGVFSLHVGGVNIRDGATMTISGIAPKKLKYKDEEIEGIFNKIIAKGRVCRSVPGAVIVTNPNG